jgi:enoyl-CoA hydratase/carnithine racemase
MVQLDKDGDVFILRMDAGENRYNPELLDAMGAALDQVENAPGPKALVTTGTGKFYSNGLDLDYMMSSDDPGAYLSRVLDLLARILVFPATTVSAVNGHAFGAGALAAVAHDFRLMRADRGFFCMPEVDMRLPLHPGMTAILDARLPRLTTHEVIATGRRSGGLEAAEKGIVEAAYSEEELLGAAVAQAAELAPKADPAMGVLKLGLHAPVLAAMKEPMPLPEAQ